MAKAYEAGEATGLTIGFGTSSFTAEIKSASGNNNEAREALDRSHLGTTSSRVFIPSKLKDPGDLTLEIHFDGDQDPPVSGAAEEITITYPIPPGLTTAGTRVFQGFVTSATPAHPETGTLMSMTVGIKISGDITKTPAS
jgi:hypothetical protein